MCHCDCRPDTHTHIHAHIRELYKLTIHCVHSMHTLCRLNIHMYTHYLSGIHTHIHTCVHTIYAKYAQICILSYSSYRYTHTHISMKSSSQPYERALTCVHFAAWMLRQEVMVMWHGLVSLPVWPSDCLQCSLPHPLLHSSKA